LPKPLSAIQGYGLAVLCVSIPLAFALFLDRHSFSIVSQSLFLLAIAIVAWYAGTGLAALAFVPSSLANDYFFIPPPYSFYITRDDVPHFVIFILVALILSWFASVRRYVERALLQSREDLKGR
jgi:K+-sensing histidine kinase KdpD